MNPIAENHTEITRKLFFEGMDAASGAEYRKTANKAVLAFAALWAALFVFSVSQGMNMIILAGEFLLIALIALWLLFLFPLFKTKRAYKIMEERSGGNMERVFRFYSDFLTVESGAGEITVQYGDIIKYAGTKRLLVFTCRDKTGVMLARDGFVSGSAEIILNQINSIQEEKK